MLKLLILKTATEMDCMTQTEIERDLGDKVSMCNVRTTALGLVQS
jgi:acyl-CoA dehydrogenase